MESYGQIPRQKYCIIGEGMDESFPWSSVVRPLAYMERLKRRGMRTMGELEFGEMGNDAYAAHERQ
jgi:hypothetical protein